MIEIEALKKHYPAIDLTEIFPYFPRLALTDDLKSEGYSWEDCHRGFIGAGGLFLVSEMAAQLELRPGSRLLDLCCGNASSSIFLAKHFGVQVVALDNEADTTANWQRVKAAGLANLIMPVKMDARDIRFPDEYFDAVFCLNSYFYFGTDGLYLPYLLRFVRPQGRIGIASPCYRQELSPDVPTELLYDEPDFKESYTVHSPEWWRDHVETMGLVNLLSCAEHPKGHEFWLDDTRWLLEQCHPRDMEPFIQQMVLQTLIMLLMDQNRLVTYFTLVAEKRK